MALTVNTNIASLNTQRNLQSSSNALSTSMQRLSTGSRINSAKDDAAGLQISNRMTSQINGLNVAVRNANDGISIAQTAEGALQQSTNLLQRMRDLSLQSANGSNSDADRQALQSEVTQLQDELTRIADTTTFGGQKILDGSFGSTAFQVGSNAHETIDVTLDNASASALGAYKLTGGTAFSSTAAATDPLDGTEDFTISQAGDSAAIDVSAGDSAEQIAAKVNETSLNITARAETRAIIDTYVTPTAAGSLTLNGVALGTLAAGSSLKDFASYINDKASQTGITAKLSSDKTKIELTGAKGEDIDFSAAAGTAFSFTIGNASQDYSTVSNEITVSAAATTTGIVKGELTLVSSESFSTVGGAETFNSSASLSSVSSIDISTYSGAQSAIDVIDGALGAIDSQRADLGAVQNRFENTIANLQSISENVSAARGRIQDTDFAAETANLSKNQILQQAGTAILAQAKQLPQAVLSLLQ
ncbi:flagellin [Stutzerimonas stutzeri]|uniref:Flagellin n=1 Tax=Stutzerimonas stutzeri TaxID=316 RepID=A0A172WUE2_STUST|nr:flagellin [Stutzerimonas stutzeri]ANF26925.1 branched-chain alpha-keto acid dehydrogenase subunit E2 [Stutzerimonas stutzeri]MCQ4283968.1 flagellin [Stutzerimonas stutzeri]BAP79918.1 putative flagellin [Pseudomonas sp. MT-1]